MATFEKILGDKIITDVTIRLPPGKSYERKLYAYPDCLKWMKQVIPTLVTGREKSAVPPRDQFIFRLRQWLSGDPIQKGPMFRELRYPTDHDVWELKTTDLRIFGWMYRPRQFIAFSGGYTDDYKDPTKIKDYADDVRAVAAAREALPLDGPKFVRGDFHDLV